MEIGIPLTLLAIFILIMVASFFAAAETALTATSRVRMHALIKAGDPRAKTVNKIREKKDRMIGALLLVNTVLNILSSALATSVLIKIFGHSGVFVATGVMTVMVLFFGEILPKTYAVHHADSMALRIAPLVRILMYVFSPFTIAMSWLVRVFLKLFDVDISKVSGLSHMEILRGAIEMHEGPDEDVQKQRAMLRSILDLYEVEVSDVMSHRRNVGMIDGGQDIESIIDSVLKSSYSRIPVWKGEQDNIIGVLHARLLLNMLKEHGEDLSQVNIQEILMEPWFIPETTTLHDQLQAFKERKEHFAVVVDEYGAFEGIVTLEDILEEIVGDIDDEHDANVAGVRRLKGGIYMINGDVTIRDLNREFEWNLPDEDYATLAGLILYESQTIPDVGQSFSFYGFQFDVVRRNRNQITKIRVTNLQKKKPASQI